MAMAATTNAPQVTPPAAARELLRRRGARAKLGAFCEYVDPEYITSRHTKIMDDALEAVEAGEITRLMICMPRRHGKSKKVSQLFPCWFLGRNPKAEFVQSGYAHGITMVHSRKSRDIFVQPEVSRLFPGVKHAPERAAQDKIAVERQAAHEWGTVQGGRYYAVGVGGGLTGRGARILSIDDPVKNREEADSPTIQQKTIDWYKSTAFPALTPDGGVILTMTRWNPNDLAGWILRNAEETGEHWEVIKLAAIDSEGNALWPEVWPLEKLEMIRAQIGEHEFQAQYQQEPVLRGGNMFDTTSIKVHESLSEFPEIRFVRFWDLASTVKERAKDDPDYTIGAKCAVTMDNGMPHLWIADVRACQQEAPRRNALILQATEDDGPGVQVLVESVAGYKDTYTTLRDLLRGKRTVKKISVSGDKVVRAAPLEPVFAAGNVHILKAQWNGMFLDQFTQFPSAAHDDCVDAVAGAFEYLRKPQPGFIDRKSVGV